MTQANLEGLLKIDNESYNLLRVFHMMMELDDTQDVPLQSMAVFMYEFIAYTPPHRCFVPECDDKTPQTFFKNHTDFSIPKDENGPSLCQMYQNEDLKCTREVFWF